MRKGPKRKKDIIGRYYSEDSSVIDTAELRIIAEELNRRDIPWVFARYVFAWEILPVEVLWCERIQYARIVWRGDGKATRATSTDDAIERYFGMHGKKIERHNPGIQ